MSNTNPSKQPRVNLGARVVRTNNTENKKMSNTNPTKQPRVNLGARVVRTNNSEN